MSGHHRKQILLPDRRGESAGCKEEDATANTSRISWPVIQVCFPATPAAPNLVTNWSGGHEAGSVLRNDTGFVM